MNKRLFLVTLTAAALGTAAFAESAPAENKPADTAKETVKSDVNLAAPLNKAKTPPVRSVKSEAEISELFKLKEMAIKKAEQQNAKEKKNQKGQLSDEQKAYRTKMKARVAPLEKNLADYQKAEAEAEARKAKIMTENEEAGKLAAEIKSLKKELDNKTAQLDQIVASDPEYAKLTVKANQLAAERSVLRGKLLSEMSSELRRRNTAFNQKVKKAEAEIRSEMEKTEENKKTETAEKTEN